MLGICEGIRGVRSGQGDEMPFLECVRHTLTRTADAVSLMCIASDNDVINRTMTSQTGRTMTSR